MEWPAHSPLVAGGGCVSVVSEHKYWQPCIFKLKVHTYQVIQSVKKFIFLANTALCQKEDVEVVLGESLQQFPSVL